METIFEKTEIAKQIDILKNLLKIENFQSEEGKIVSGYAYDWMEEDVELIKNKILELVKKL